MTTATNDTATNDKTIEVAEVRLRFARALSPGEATHLRGYFGDVFREETLLHHHRADGSLVYEYPKVQFKVLDRTASLVGIESGADLIERLWLQVDQTRLGDEVLPVLEGNLRRRREPFGEADASLEYRFRTPWLGLNQQNHQRYDQARSDAERQEVLARVLVGNCLSLAKSLGHRVQARLAAETRRLRPHPVRFKGLPMLAFEGPFRVNFRIPSRLGLGKSVSRGFGTVEAEERTC